VPDFFIIATSKAVGETFVSKLVPVKILRPITSPGTNNGTVDGLKKPLVDIKRPIPRYPICSLAGQKEARQRQV
jgi:hypothetical protein